MEKKYPKFVVGSFIINTKGELFLRTTPSQDNKYTCINEKVLWGESIEDTLTKSVQEKTGLKVESFELIGLTDGLNIPIPDGVTNLIFADYKVLVGNMTDFKTNKDREYKWLLPQEWLDMGENAFGPYIYEVIEKLA